MSLADSGVFFLFFGVAQIFFFVFILAMTQYNVVIGADPNISDARRAAVQEKINFVLSLEADEEFEDLYSDAEEDPQGVEAPSGEEKVEADLKAPVVSPRSAIMKALFESDTEWVVCLWGEAICSMQCWTLRGPLK